MDGKALDAETARNYGNLKEDAKYRLEALRENLGDLDSDSPALYFGREAAEAARKQVRVYYRQLGPTKEWAENNYWHLRITQQDGNLIPVSAFWRDYAKWVADGAQGAFVSPNVAEASHNFAEMMLALAVLDLPFEAPKHDGKADAGQFTLTAGGPVIVYHKEIKPAAPLAENAQQVQLLVSQSFFRAGDRYRMEGNEKFEKYVTEEFLTGTVYGANVVVTNPTSAPAKAEVLLQIPQGALPVQGSKATDSKLGAARALHHQDLRILLLLPRHRRDGQVPAFPGERRGQRHRRGRGETVRVQRRRQAHAGGQGVVGLYLAIRQRGRSVRLPRTEQPRRARVAADRLALP